MNTSKIVRCPSCGKNCEYSPLNSFRPFCSERCRVTDLGAWASGTYAVAAEPSELQPEEIELLMSELEKSADAVAGGESAGESFDDALEADRKGPRQK